MMLPSFFSGSGKQKILIFFPKSLPQWILCFGYVQFEFQLSFLIFCNNESYDLGYLFMHVNFILCSKMLKQDGLSMARSGTNSNYQRMTSLLIMPMVCSLFILSNGLMLTLCMSLSMFGLVTGYQELSTFIEGLYTYMTH